MTIPRKDNPNSNPNTDLFVLTDFLTVAEIFLLAGASSDYLQTHVVSSKQASQGDKALMHFLACAIFIELLPGMQDLESVIKSQSGYTYWNILFVCLFITEGKQYCIMGHGGFRLKEARSVPFKCDNFYMVLADCDDADALFEMRQLHPAPRHHALVLRGLHWRWTMTKVQYSPWSADAWCLHSLWPKSQPRAKYIQFSSSIHSPLNCITLSNECQIKASQAWYVSAPFITLHDCANLAPRHLLACLLRSWVSGS